MKKYLLAAICCMGLSIALKAQTGLPTVHLNAPSGICDIEPYKLVFSDDFNGDMLSQPWHKYRTCQHHET